ncbi:hypothetical protein NEOLEDRAFT_1176521 [Neolentinus lepideus HHB14362 ss-1]|uniref:C2H2-type domain-containing protein n=1 Tax=Neolentinus lepideus HHB14362 ss-1 TaxID=1314782 RepID=A0A165U185_9AGAM|nr:hypothetical protein NEOLEDRAFT_1176521 [Neolentinus lepideus HHB14362 ss-1]
MVRAHIKQSPEEKKEAAKKKAAAARKKTPSESGVWPCKINGCNKQFAREADLKRHQRTTKLHSTPGFRCPQCDASFTRTDALRRHQKSRHNGVVIEPGDEEKTGEGSSGSKSRSGSPAASGAKSTASASVQTTIPVTVTQSSYYRPHTMHAGYIPPHPQTGESHYPPSIGLPTSATRGSWPGAPAWTPEGGPPQMGQFQSYYQPSPYYRTSVGGTQSQQPPGSVNQGHPNAGHAAAEGSAEGASGSDEASNAPPSTAIVDPQLSGGDTEMKDRDGNGDAGHVKSPTPPSAPVIDPALEGGLSAAAPASAHLDEQPKPVSMQMTAAAMQAVIEAIAPKSESEPADPAALTREVASAEQQVPVPTTAAPSGQVAEPPSSNELDAQNMDAEADADGEADIDPQLEEMQAQDSVQQARMEPMLTEDGEPMLNPAELLTQESLASPPFA